MNFWEKMVEDNLCQWRELVGIDPHGIHGGQLLACLVVENVIEEPNWGIAFYALLLSSGGLPCGQFLVALLLFDVVLCLASVVIPFLTREISSVVCRGPRPLLKTQSPWIVTGENGKKYRSWSESCYFLLSLHLSENREYFSVITMLFRVLLELGAWVLHSGRCEFKLWLYHV